MAEIEAPDSTGWSASHYNKEASFVYSPAFTAPVLELLSAKPGERIIDFGCGSGELTLEIEKLVKCNNNQKGMVVGVDFSESMISKARLNGLEHAFVSDIQALAIPGEYAFNGPADKFDAVFSSAALHWCKRDPRGVLASVKRVLKPGGRFVGEMGGFGNVIGVRSCLHTVLREQGHDPRNRDPWYFPSPEEYSRLLESEGFIVKHISLTPRITPLTGDLVGWLSLFVRPTFLSQFTDMEAAEILNAVQERCAVDCRDETGHWITVYTRLRFDTELH